jgi:HEAT repeat protein
MKKKICGIGLVATQVVSAKPAVAANADSVGEFIEKIKSKEDRVRGPAWQHAETMGAPAVQPLAGLMVDQDFEIAQAARRALYRIVRHAGRPGAKAEAKAVVAAVIPMLRSAQALVRKDAAWMLSEIAGDEAIEPMAALLSDAEVREDVRCALMRFPGRKATSAFKAAFAAAPEEFKGALADTLRERGVKVQGYPSQKVVPSRKTEVGV